MECLDNVFQIYINRGFKIKILLMDREIMPMIEDLKQRGIIGNPTSASEHVPEVERHIRVVKERIRGLYNSLPFDRIPLLMMKQLVYYVIAWINNFPPKGGISKFISPRTLITGVNIDYNKHCKLEYGQYVQVHEENNPTNSMHPRATGAIALGSTYNLQTGYKFMSLNTGKLIHRRNFTIIPISQDVINRVNEFGMRQNRPSKLSFLGGNEDNDTSDTGQSDSEDDVSQMRTQK